MASTDALREEAMLRPLRQHFEAKGYAFFERPATELVPAFLGAYTPDAIAYDNAGGGVVIELKSRPSAAPDDRLSKIAKLFGDHKEWKFHVVYGSGDPEIDTELEVPAIGTIRTAFSELEALESAGHYQAGFLFAWGLLESAGRLLDHGARAAASPRDLIERLTSEGFLTQATSAKLRQLIPLRHAIAHGDFARAVGQSDLATMKVAIEEALDRLSPRMG